MSVQKVAQSHGPLVGRVHARERTNAGDDDPWAWSHRPGPLGLGWRGKIVRPLSALMPDRLYFSLRYFFHFGRWPNYSRPRHFNEFTHVYMMTCRNPLLTRVADKVTARAYVSETVGTDHLVPLLGVWDCADDVPVGDLPRPFVLKDSLGCARNIFVGRRSSIDVGAVKSRLRDWQETAFWKSHREWAYRNGRSKIVAEVFLDDTSGHLPFDYKVYTLGGKVQFIQVDRGRFGAHTRNLYSPDWQLLPVRLTKQRHAADPEPPRLQEMRALAEKLAQPFEFLRVDFFCIGERLYIGELTNYSGAGFETFIPHSFGEQLGDRWRSVRQERAGRHEVAPSNRLATGR